MNEGDEVTYIPKMEHGIVKGLSDQDHVFVVYHCAGDWDHYRDYTAARTRIKDLVPGWLPLFPEPDDNELEVNHESEEEG
jgi:hypothetical protein